MKRNREEPINNSISIIPIDSWPIIFKFCSLDGGHLIDIETYDIGDGLFSMACTSKQMLAITDDVIKHGPFYSEKQDHEIIRSLCRFPVRAYHIINKRHYAKRNAINGTPMDVPSVVYSKTIEEILVTTVSRHLIYSMLKDRVPIYDGSGNVMVKVSLRMQNDNMTHWIDYCYNKYNESYATICAIKETLNTIICTPKIAFIQSYTGYSTVIELRFDSIHDIESGTVTRKIRAINPIFADYEFNV